MDPTTDAKVRSLPNKNYLFKIIQSQRPTLVQLMWFSVTSELKNKIPNCDH